MFNNVFFRIWYRLWDEVEMYCRVGEPIDDNMAHAHCMLDNKGYWHAQSEKAILIAFPLQQLLQEHLSLLGHTYIASLICNK